MEYCCVRLEASIITVVPGFLSITMPPYMLQTSIFGDYCLSNLFPAGTGPLICPRRHTWYDAARVIWPVMSVWQGSVFATCMPYFPLFVPKILHMAIMILSMYNILTFYSGYWTHLVRYSCRSKVFFFMIWSIFTRIIDQTRTIQIQKGSNSVSITLTTVFATSILEIIKNPGWTYRLHYPG